MGAEYQIVCKTLAWWAKAPPTNTVMMPWEMSII